MIRYPGSKAKLIRQIVRHFPWEYHFALFRHGPMEYREPFFGAGAIGLEVLTALSPETHVWLNDKDAGMVAMWNAVRSAPRELKDLIDVFRPSAEKFYEFKTLDELPLNGNGRPDTVWHGFRKLALHQMSFSGLGVKAGGPLGGRSGSSTYSPECRWNPHRLKLRVERIHRLLASFSSLKITERDFAAVIQDAPPHCLIYADPPYYVKGEQLYKHAMTDEDHRRLADLLRATPATWFLSYDDHPIIRELYAWARIRQIDTTYTTATASGTRRRKNHEILIEREAAT